MRVTFNAGVGDVSKKTALQGSVRPVDRPPTTTGLGSSITGPVSSASGGGTILGATIPVAYGYNKLTAYLSFARREQEKLWLSWVYASGKVPALVYDPTPPYTNGTLKQMIFNSEPIEEAFGNKAGFKFAHRNGEVNQAVDGYIGLLGSEFQFKHPGMAMVTGYCKDTRECDVSSLNMKVITDGRLFVDFRTPLASEASIVNPVSVAWDILTATWPWPGFLDSETSSANVDIHYDQWAEWADWCESTTVEQYDYRLGAPGSSKLLTGQNRWDFNGIVKQTNPWTAADAVLYSSFLKLVYVDGKVMLRAETDVVPTSVYIPEGRFIGVPTINDTNPDIVPSEMEIAYISKVDFSECKIVYTRPSAPGKYVKLASTIYGCNSQKQAIRWAEQKTWLLNENWIVKMVCGIEVVDTAPGDIIKAFLPYGFGDSYVRVMSIISKPELGKYEISGRIVIDSTVSLEDMDEYTGSDADGGWETGTPAVPASFSCTAGSVKTSKDTYQPVIDAIWTPPLTGPRPRYYELKQGSTIIARAFGLKWSGPVLGTDATIISVHAISYSGLPGPSLSVGVNLNIGYVSGLGGVDLDSMGDDDGGTYIYNESTNAFEYVVMPANFEVHTITIPNGSTAVGDSIKDITNTVRTVTASITESASPWVPYTVAFSGHAFGVQLPDGPYGYNIVFSVVVGVYPKASTGEQGGATLPEEEES